MTYIKVIEELDLGLDHRAIGINQTQRSEGLISIENYQYGVCVDTSSDISIETTMALLDLYKSMIADSTSEYDMIDSFLDETQKYFETHKDTCLPYTLQTKVNLLNAKDLNGEVYKVHIPNISTLNENEVEHPMQISLAWQLIYAPISVTKLVCDRVLAHNIYQTEVSTKDIEDHLKKTNPDYTEGMRWLAENDLRQLGSSPTSFCPLTGDRVEITLTRNQYQ